MALSLERWKGQVCIVTGASSGIGAAVAEKLALEGLQVIGIARRKERLEQLATLVGSNNGILHPFVGDITKQDDVIRLFNWAGRNVGPVSVLVNAAGVWRNSPLIAGETKLWKDVFDTNVLALCTVTREAVNNMRENNIHGHVIHINSIGGHVVPDVPSNVYCASKHAVTALTEALRQELNFIASNIKITSISPALVRTEFFHAAAIGSGQSEIDPSYKDMLDHGPHLDIAAVTDAVIYSLSTPPHVQVHDIILRPVGSTL